jgi:hypothetical protein
VGLASHWPRRKCVHPDSISELTTTCQIDYKWGGLNDPNRTSFELQLNPDMTFWLEYARSTNAQRTVSGCSRMVDSPDGLRTSG